MNTSTTDQQQQDDSLLYPTYKNAGFTYELAIPASIFYLVAALLCFFEVLHQSGHTYFFFVIITGKNFVRMFSAQLFSIPQMFGLNGAIMAMFCASFDRLFAIAFPLKHKKISLMHRHLYLSVHTLICIAYSVYNLYYVFAASTAIAEKPITGCICEILTDDSVRNNFFFLSLALNFACICCYLLIWAKIRSKNEVRSETNLRLLRSLVIILCVNVGGYLINLTIYMLTFTFRHQLGNSVRLWQFTFIAAILLNVCASANAPILYLNSTEYRKAIKTALRDFFRLKSNTDGTTSATVHPANIVKRNVPPMQIGTIAQQQQQKQKPFRKVARTI